MSYRAKYEDDGRRRYGDDNKMNVERRMENARKGLRSAYGIMAQSNSMIKRLMNDGRVREADRVREIADRYLSNLMRTKKWKSEDSPEFMDAYSIGFSRDEYIGKKRRDFLNGKTSKLVGEKTASSGAGQKSKGNSAG